MLALAITYILTTQFKLPLEFLLLGRAFSGLTGDFYSLSATSYAYFADISTPATRTVNVAKAGACLGLGGLVANLISGPWIEAQVWN